MTIVGADIALLLESSIIPFLYVLAALLATSPIVYLVTVVVYWVYKHKRFGLDITRQLRAWRNG